LIVTEDGPAKGDLFIHEHAREGSEPYKHHCEYSEADEPRAELSHGFDSFLPGVLVLRVRLDEPQGDALQNRRDGTEQHYEQEGDPDRPAHCLRGHDLAAGSLTATRSRSSG